MYIYIINKKGGYKSMSIEELTKALAGTVTPMGNCSGGKCGTKKTHYTC